MSVSVTASLVGVLSKQPNGSSWFSAHFWPVLYCRSYYTAVRVIPIIRVLSFGTFSQNSGLRKFRYRTLIFATCCQLRSTNVDVQCDKLATVVGQTKLTILAPSTFDQRNTPVCHTERSAVCRTRCMWSSSLRSAFCRSWYLALNRSATQVQQLYL